MCNFITIKWGICTEKALRSLSSAFSNSMFIVVSRAGFPPGRRLWIRDKLGGLLGSSLGSITCGVSGIDAGLARGRKSAAVQSQQKLKLGYWSEEAGPSYPTSGSHQSGPLRKSVQPWVKCLSLPPSSKDNSCKGLVAEDFLWEAILAKRESAFIPEGNLNKATQPPSWIGIKFTCVNNKSLISFFSF